MTWVCMIPNCEEHTEGENLFCWKHNHDWELYKHISNLPQKATKEETYMLATEFMYRDKQ